MAELETLGDPMVAFSARQAVEMMDAPEEALERFQAGKDAGPKTPAGRLLQRARSEYDRRGSEVAPRQRAAVDFANRPGQAQDDAALAELEAGMSDGDPMVREVATLACIQVYRFRALRLAELDQAYVAVESLVKIDHRAAVAALIEVMAQYRTGYLSSPTGMVETDNGKLRMAALIRLVEWHTPDAQSAVRALRFDRDSHLVRAAEKALEAFPGDWKGPLKAQG